MTARRIDGWRTAAVLALMLAGAPARAQSAPVFVPHHAVYKLSLTRSTGEKAPAAASGAISYDFSGNACDGYSTTFRQMTEVQPSEGEARVSDMRSATFEDGSAKQFRFNTQTTYSSAEPDDLDGAAAKQSDGSVTVALQKPQSAQATLTQAVFPTEHLMKVIESARAGKHLLTEPVYDGSDTGKTVFDTLAVIGAPITVAAEDKALQADSLRNVARWPVSISYFDQSKSDSQPVYVLSFELYENGISRALKLDYGTFVLSGELEELKLLGTPACKQ